MRKNRNLDTIAAEIRETERDSVFARGKLLNEAMDACKHGEWGSWLWDEFAMSTSTADRLRGCAALADKFPKLTKIPLAKSTVYSLLDYSDDEQALVIPALAKATTRKPLKPAAAEEVMKCALLAHEHGNLPAAALLVIDDLIDEPWAKTAIEMLRAERPATKEAARETRRAAAQLYMGEVCGKLPQLSYGALRGLAQVDEADRSLVVEKIIAEPARAQAEYDILEIEREVVRAQHDDEAPPQHDDEAPEHALKRDLFDALDTLRFYITHGMPLPVVVKEFTVAELVKIEKLVRDLREIAAHDAAPETVSKQEREAYLARVKKVADRAEARSRQSAAGQ
jgi:Protein of unknown function (DUF3102)